MGTDDSVEINEYDLVYHDGSTPQQGGLLRGKGWYIQETPSGRVSQLFATRDEALEAFEKGRLRLTFLH